MKTASIQVTLIDHMGDDLSVVNAARVSFEKESYMECDCGGVCYGDCNYQLPEQDRKLINYLAKHKHTSPFNHAFLSFRVKAPIFVARQLVKHKFLPWNEVSRRYVDSEPEFYVPSLWRKRATNVKQGSSEDAVETDSLWMESTKLNSKESLMLYNDMLAGDVCPEQARMVLPQNMMTEWIWSGSLGAFADMCRLRLDPHSQKETRIVAEQIANHISVLFPVSWKALINEC